MAKQSITEIMYDHRKDIMAFYAESGGNVKGTWELARERIRALSDASLSQWKPNMAMLLLYEKGMDGSEQDVIELEAENAALKAELDKLQPDRNTPKGKLREVGWSLVPYGEFWKCFRKVGGKVFGLHLGRNLDVDRNSGDTLLNSAFFPQLPCL
ncbi:MAG: hypothetical protein GY852_01240, partial [bacterium]|nr:hypothetical protein [bacterium]